MKTPRNYFAITKYIWTEFFESRKGNRGWGDTMSLTERDRLLTELRATIPTATSTLDDKQLLDAIKKAKEESLKDDINQAFKQSVPSKTQRRNKY